MICLVIKVILNELMQFVLIGIRLLCVNQDNVTLTASLPVMAVPPKTDYHVRRWYIREISVKVPFEQSQS
jgi:hypothetical protein